MRNALPLCIAVTLAVSSPIGWANPCTLVNGNFESATPFEGWVVVTDPPDAHEFIPWRITTGAGFFYPNVGPYEGEQFAQNGFDGDAGLIYELYQEVEIPADAPVAILEWADRIQWDLVHPWCNPCYEPRLYEVTVQPEGGGEPLLVLHEFLIEPGTQSDPDTEYLFHSIDLLEWAPQLRGTTVRLHWFQYVPETSTGPAQFDLDAVCLRFTLEPIGGEGEGEGEGEEPGEGEGEGEGEEPGEGEGEGESPGTAIVYVDYRNTGYADGSAAFPYRRFLEGVDRVPEGGIVRTAEGKYDEQVRITRPMRLEAYGGPVRVGIPE